VLEEVEVVAMVDSFEVRGKTNENNFFFPKNNKKNV
jgi:hypothetical protein